MKKAKENEIGKINAREVIERTGEEKVKLEFLDIEDDNEETCEEKHTLIVKTERTENIKIDFIEDNDEMDDNGHMFYKDYSVLSNDPVDFPDKKFM